MYRVLRYNIVVPNKKIYIYKKISIYLYMYIYIYIYGEIEKDEKHERAVTQAGGHFYPLIVETLGHWSPSSLETLKTIASKASSMNHIPFS